MPTSGTHDKAARAKATRRQFLLGGAVAGVGAAAVIGLDSILNRPDTPATATQYNRYLLKTFV